MKNIYVLVITVSLFLLGKKVNGQSEIWGVTPSGGTGFGTIFGAPTGSTGFSTIYSFPGAQGSSPQMTRLIQASNGKLYGMTFAGGSNSVGTLFEYDISTNTYTKKVDLSSALGSSPRGALMQASDGNLYGMTSAGGANGLGVIFQYSISTGTYTKKYDMVFANGTQPFGALVELASANGKLYGMTRAGGTNSVGTVFEYDINTNTYTKKQDFSNTLGILPFGDFVQSGSLLYGMTNAGGTNSVGTIVEYDYTNNVLTKKIDLAQSTGATPQGSLLKASDGNLYGMTTSGGTNSVGVIFQYSISTNSYNKLVDLSSTIGSAPSGNLVQASNGKFYGMTRLGGANSQGVLFEYNLATSTYTPLFALANNTVIGGNTFTSPMIASNGKIYGPISAGGLSGVGVLFEYDLSTNTYTKKIDLNYAPNGGNSTGGLVYAANGKLYGTGLVGGVNNLGVIYEYNKTTSTYTKLFDMSTTGGSSPTGAMLEASNGKLYGLCALGGTANAGALYEFDYTTNTYTKKVDLNSTIGSSPVGNLIQAANGKLYGLTRAGGTNGLGALFEYDIVTNTYTKKVDFTSTIGSQPRGSLVEAPNGKLYGLTQTGGFNAVGVLFEFDPSTNTYTNKFDLTTSGGNQPQGSMVLANDGNLYGMTSLGGANNVGTLFQYDYINNVYTKKADFSTTLGSGPQGSLIKTANGKLYGVTFAGGTNSVGTVVEYDVTNATLTKLIDFSSTIGGNGMSPGLTRLVEVCPKPSVPGAITAASNSVCVNDGGSKSFSISTVATATSYVWTLPSGASIVSGSLTNAITANLSGVSAGVYTYSVAGTNFCGTGSVSTATLTVSVLPTITVNSGTICNGTTFTINPSGAATYTYQGGSNVVSPSSTTNYTVLGTNSAGCIAANSATATVTVNAIPTVSISPSSSVICAGNSSTLTASGAATYVWSTGSTAGSIVQSPSSTTSYTVIGTSAASCTNLALQTISVNSLPSIGINPSSSSICSGNSATLTANGGSSYVWSTGSTAANIVVSPASNTTYTVIGTNAATGCTNSAIQAIGINTTPTVVITPASTVICNGNSVLLTGSGANTYAWNTGATSNAINVSPGSTTGYTLTGTSAAGCTNSAVQSISVNALPVISISSTGTVICTGKSTTLTANGGNSYVWNTGPTTSTISLNPTSNTTYTVIGTSATTGCSNTAVQSVSVNALPVVSISTSTNTICNGATATLTANGASSYSWSTGSTSNPLGVNPSSGTTYTVTGTSATTGCSNTAIQSIAVNTLPVVSAGVSSSTVCAGGSVTFNGSGASTYVWTGGPVNNTPFSPSSTNSYSVTGTNALTGCTSTNVAAVTVTVYALPVVTANSSTSSVCQGQSVTLTGGGANTYVWTGSAVNGVAFAPSTTNSYSVTGTSTAGCTSTNVAAVTVTVNPLPVISGSASSPSVCAGGTVSLNGSGASTYIWTSGTGTIANGAAFAPTSTGSYTVAGASAFGCISSNFPVVSVTVNALPAITVNSGTICSGQNFTLTAGGAFTYTYSSGSNVVSPAVSTSYSVSGTSTAGCVSATPAISNVTVFALPVVSLNSGTMCAGGSFLLSPTLTPASSGTFSYTGGVTTISSGSISVSPVNTATYSVSGTNSLGCVSSNFAVATVTVRPLPVVTASNGASCSGAVFNPTVAGANSYTYSFVGTTVSPTITSVYSVIGSNAFGCVSNPATPFTVTVYSLPTVGIAGSNTVCSGSSLTLTANGANTYNWGTSTGSVLVVTPTGGTTTYSVSGTDTNNCSALAAISVSVLSTPTITANNGAICPGNSYTIIPSGASSYTISGGSAVVSPSATTSYSVVGSNTAGCVSQNTAVVTVSVVNVLTVTINGISALCTGQSGTLVANGASTYTWSNGTPFSGITVSPTVTTTYSVIGASGTCSNIASTTVTVNPLPIVTCASSSNSLCLGETATLTANGAVNYTWAPSFANGASIVTSPTISTVYSVTGTDANNCSNGTTLALSVDACVGIGELSKTELGLLVYPNPNNGAFTVEVPSEAKLTVHNALGELVMSDTLTAGKNTLSLGNSANGIYFVKVQLGSQSKITRLIKQ